MKVSNVFCTVIKNNERKFVNYQNYLLKNISYIRKYNLFNNVRQKKTENETNITKY